MDAISFLAEIAPIMDQLFPIFQPVLRLRTLMDRINGSDWETAERTIAVTIGLAPSIQFTVKQVKGDSLDNT